MALIAVHTTSKYTLVADQDACQTLAMDVEADWFSSAFWRQHKALIGSADGRGTTYFIKHNGHEMVLRHYKRGGLVRHLSDDWFMFTGIKNTRPYAELKLLNDMNNANLPVPQGIGGLIVKTGIGYRADILTLRIPDAKDVHASLLTHRLPDSVWICIGEAIRALHDAQVYHHDLNIKNIMLDGAGKVWIIDFDKCARKAGDTWKQHNLDRLLRSLRKQQAITPDYGFVDAHWEHVIKGYRG